MFVSTRACRTLLLYVAVLANGCGGDRGGPTGPDPAQTAGPIISATAYLDEVLQVRKSYSINTSRIDWGSFRSEVVASAGAAQTMSDAHRGVDVALRSSMTPRATTPAEMVERSALRRWVDARRSHRSHRRCRYGRPRPGHLM